MSTLRNLLARFGLARPRRSRAELVAAYRAAVLAAEGNPEAGRELLRPEEIALLSDRELERYAGSFTGLRGHRIEEREREALEEFGAPPPTAEELAVPASYTVIVMDMAHYQDPEHELELRGFPTRELAVEFARRRVRDSLEALRQPGQSAAELRKLWSVYGEEALVVGGDYAGSRELDRFIREPATPEERDWTAVQRKAGIG